MNISAPFKAAPKAALLTGLALAATLGLHPSAWALYKTIGPDGRPIYSDRPLGNGPTTQIAADGTTVSSTNLPFELRKIVSRFPVTLYTSSDCGPCDAGRNLLKQRGVPFRERTIATPEDAEALKRAEGSTDLPILRVGGQRMQGFSASEWNSYLDAAGYPKSSQLPPNYQFDPPQPLSGKSASPAAKASEPRQPAPPAAPPAPAGGNAPPGFKF